MLVPIQIKTAVVSIDEGNRINQNFSTSLCYHMSNSDYRRVSNIRRTKYQNDSRLVLQLSVPDQLKPSVKSITQM